MPIDGADLIRFESKFIRGNPDECWLWLDKPTKDGYGLLSIGGRSGKKFYAHRLSYEQYVGPIPDGFTIDHVHVRGCRSTLCVNPGHLEPVTLEENSRRRPVPITCPRGHPKEGPEADIYVNPKTGARLCRPCARIHDRKRRPRRD